jgi:hypothetical protein
MLRKDERPGLKHQNAAAACCVRNEKMFRDDGPKGAAADDDDIEVTLPTGDGLLRTFGRFFQIVAKKAPHIIQRE